MKGRRDRIEERREKRERERERERGPSNIKVVPCDPWSCFQCHHVARL